MLDDGAAYQYLSVIGGITHDLASELNNVATIFACARLENRNPKVARLLDKAGSRIEYAMADIHRIHVLLRLAEGGPVEPDRVALDRSWIAGIINQFRHRSTKVAVTVDLPQGCQIYADPELITVALRNIVDQLSITSADTLVELTATCAGRDVVIAGTHSKHEPGSGERMYLQLAQQIAQLHGGA